MFSWEVLAAAGFIFILRVVDMSFATLRFMLVLRGRRGLSWVFGFLQALVFVWALSTVLQNLDNLLNVIAYASGYATGGVVGAWIEERMAIGHTHLRIISPKFGAAVAMRLREEGYGVTEVSGRGRDGVVTLINASVLRKNAKKVRDIVREIDEEAFMTAEDLRPVRRGIWRA